MPRSRQQAINEKIWQGFTSNNAILLGGLKQSILLFTHWAVRFSLLCVQSIITLKVLYVRQYWKYLMKGKARKETQRGPTHHLPCHKGFFLIGKKGIPKSHKAIYVCLNLHFYLENDSAKIQKSKKSIARLLGKYFVSRLFSVYLPSGPVWWSLRSPQTQRILHEVVRHLDRAI